MTKSSSRLRDLATAAVASTLTLLIGSAGASGGPVVSQAPPRNTSPPSISGTARVGSTLVANLGGWSGTQPVTFSFQWFRCTAQVADCVNTGVTTRTYALRDADLGRRLLVLITARNEEGSAQARATSAVVQRRAVAPRNTIAPSISGTAEERQTLTANPGTWSGDRPITFSFQWLRCDANGGNCANIAGATNRTYVLATADVGSSIRVRVTARNAGGSASLQTPPTAVVRAGPPPGPGGQIRLPDGRISIPIESVALPVRLVVDAVEFSPNPVRSRRQPFTIRVHVSDTRGFVVRGALVFARSTPLLTTAPPQSPTGLDGWVSLETQPRLRVPGLRFPLQRGLNVQFYVQARKPGERLLFGVTGSRLVQVATAPPR